MVEVADGPVSAVPRLALVQHNPRPGLLVVGHMTVPRDETDAARVRNWIAFMESGVTVHPKDYAAIRADGNAALSRILAELQEVKAEKATRGVFRSLDDQVTIDTLHAEITSLREQLEKGRCKRCGEWFRDSLTQPKETE